MKDWLKRSKQSLLTILIILFGCILIYMFIRFNARYAKNTQRTLESNSAILNQLDLTNPDSNLSKLQANNIRDNADQTLLICKIILGQNVSLSGTDAHAVEVICRQKIKDAQSQSSPPSVQNNTSQHTPLSQTSNKNSNIKAPKQQPDNGGGEPDNDGLMTPTVDVGPIHIPSIHIPSPL